MLIGEQPRLMNPLYVIEGNRQKHSPSPVHSEKSAYEGVVSATDGLLGARGTTPGTDDRDWVAAEPNKTLDGGKDDPEQSAEGAERRWG